jgi:hypothetical protein
MVIPSLSAGVEKGFFVSGLGIETGCVVAFGGIAIKATQGAVSRRVVAAFRCRLDVLDMKCVCADVLRSVAILALPGGAFLDLFA